MTPPPAAGHRLLPAPMPMSPPSWPCSRKARYCCYIGMKIFFPPPFPTTCFEACPFSGEKQGLMNNKVDNGYSGRWKARPNNTPAESSGASERVTPARVTSQAAADTGGLSRDGDARAGPIPGDRHAAGTSRRRSPGRACPSRPAHRCPASPSFSLPFPFSPLTPSELTHATSYGPHKQTLQHVSLLIAPSARLCHYIQKLCWTRSQNNSWHDFLMLWKTKVISAGNWVITSVNSLRHYRFKTKGQIGMCSKTIKFQRGGK